MSTHTLNNLNKRQFKPHLCIKLKQVNSIWQPYCCTVLLLEPKNFTTAQLISIRKALRKVLSKSDKMWFNISAIHPMTSKSTGVRIGKGKGLISHRVKPINAGSVLCKVTIKNISKFVVVKKLLSVRSSVKLKFINNLQNHVAFYKPLVFNKN